MKNDKKTNLGLVISAGYLGLFFLAGIYAIYLLVFHTGTSEFCGLPAILLTLPWSMLLFPLVNALGIVQWYGQFAGSPALYGFWAMMTLLPSALINAAILYTAGSYLDKMNDPHRDKPLPKSGKSPNR